MKKMLALIALFMALVCCCAALAEGECAEPPDVRIWNGFAVTVEPMEEGGIQSGPLVYNPAGMKEDEYCVHFMLDIPEALWKDEALLTQLYAETVVTDANGTVYHGAVRTTGTETPVVVYFYCIPNTVPFDTLSVTVGTARAIPTPKV